MKGSARIPFPHAWLQRGDAREDADGPYPSSSTRASWRPSRSSPATNARDAIDGTGSITFEAAAERLLLIGRDEIGLAPGYYVHVAVVAYRGRHGRGDDRSGGWSLSSPPKSTARARDSAWRGKDRQDWSDLIVQAPPLYIQEKVHPKAIIDDLTRTHQRGGGNTANAPNLFADFNGVDPEASRTEFYQHDQHWSNRMILGDSLFPVMASLAEREGLRGKVQCIYFDPPYGIKFNS